MLTLEPDEEHLVHLFGNDPELVKLRERVVKVSYELGSKAPRVATPQGPIEKRDRSDTASKILHNLGQHFRELAYHDYIRASGDRMSMVWDVWNDFSVRLKGGFMKDGPQRNAWWTTLVSTDHQFLMFEEILTDLDAEMVSFARAMTTERTGGAFMNFIATLLALTPELILQRIRLASPEAACPAGLKRRSWERPELSGEIRYAPPRLYPSIEMSDHILPWDKSNSIDTIRGTVESTLQRLATTNLEGVHSQTVYAAIEGSLNWLLEPIVKEWYLKQLRPHERASFSILVTHMMVSAMHVVNSDGPYIGLSFLLLLNPYWVEGWMMLKHPDTPSHQGAPPFPGSAAHPTSYAHLPASFHRFEHNPATRAFFHHQQPYESVAHALGLRAAVRYGKMARYW